MITKIAIPYENGKVFQHFGHTEQFKIYEIKDGAIANSAIVNTNGSGHGALARYLKLLQVDALICGGIGGGARNALTMAAIAIYPGVQGDADSAAQALLDGTLAYDPAAQCNHHHDEGHEHNCGEHNCGGHCHDHK